MKTNVTFDSAGLKIAGYLYTPDDGATGPRSAIVVSSPGSSVKELHWIDGASHNDLYDGEQYVAPTIAKLGEFYAANLAERAVA